MAGKVTVSAGARPEGTYKEVLNSVPDNKSNNFRELENKKKSEYADVCGKRSD